MSININTAKFGYTEVVNGIIKSAKKYFSGVTYNQKDYGNYLVTWIHISNPKYVSEFELRIVGCKNGVYTNPATYYPSRPYGSIGNDTYRKYSGGYYGKVYEKPEGGVFKNFTPTDGYRSISISYSGGERFKPTNEFYKKFHQFYHTIYCVAWETGGFSIKDPYVATEKYYIWGSLSGWFDNLPREIIRRRKTKRWWDNKIKFRGTYWYWDGKGGIQDWYFDNDQTIDIKLKESIDEIDGYVNFRVV